MGTDFQGAALKYAIPDTQNTEVKYLRNPIAYIIVEHTRLCLLCLLLMSHRQCMGKNVYHFKKHSTIKSNCGTISRPSACAEMCEVRVDFFFRVKLTCPTTRRGFGAELP